MKAPARRPRGTETTQINLRVVPDAKDRLDSIAHAANVPYWAVFESAMRAVKLDEHGIPEGWDLPRPSTDTLLDVEETRKTA